MKKRYPISAAILLLAIAGTAIKFSERIYPLTETSEPQNNTGHNSIGIRPQPIESLDQDTTVLNEEERFALYVDHIHYLSRDPGHQPGDFVSDYGSYRKAPPNHKEIIPFLAEVLDSGDLELATRLIDEIPDEFLRNRVQTLFTQEIAKRLSPNQAIELLDQIDVNKRTGALVAFFAIKDLVDTDPRKAADWTLQLPSKYSQKALSQVCGAWKNQNQDSGYEALDYLSALPEQIEIDEVLSGLVAFPKNNPELFNTITEAIRNPTIKSDRYGRMALHLYVKGNYQESFEWMARARDGDTKHGAKYDKTLNEWMQKHPDAAAAFIEVNKSDDSLQTTTEP